VIRDDDWLAPLAKFETRSLNEIVAHLEETLVRAPSLLPPSR